MHRDASTGADAAGVDVEVRAGQLWAEEMDRVTPVGQHLVLDGDRPRLDETVLCLALFGPWLPMDVAPVHDVEQVTHTSHDRVDRGCDPLDRFGVSRPDGCRNRVLQLPGHRSR